MVQLLWDVRTALEENEARMLEMIMARPKQKKIPKYWILKHSNWTNHDMYEMKSTYMIRSSKPPKMLGTVLWKVDNNAGTITKVWELPLDVECFREYLDPHNPQEIVHHSAQDVKGAIVIT